MIIHGYIDSWADVLSCPKYLNEETHDVVTDLPFTAKFRITILQRDEEKCLSTKKGKHKNGLKSSSSSSNSMIVQGTVPYLSCDVGYKLTIDISFSPNRIITVESFCPLWSAEKLYKFCHKFGSVHSIDVSKKKQFEKVWNQEYDEEEEIGQAESDDEDEAVHDFCSSEDSFANMMKTAKIQIQAQKENKILKSPIFTKYLQKVWTNLLSKSSVARMANGKLVDPNIKLPLTWSLYAIRSSTKLNEDEDTDNFDLGELSESDEDVDYSETETEEEEVNDEDNDLFHFSRLLEKEKNEKMHEEKENTIEDFSAIEIEIEEDLEVNDGDEDSSRFLKEEENEEMQEEKRKIIEKEKENKNCKVQFKVDVVREEKNNLLKSNNNNSIVDVEEEKQEIDTVTDFNLVQNTRKRKRADSLISQYAPMSKETEKENNQTVDIENTEEEEKEENYKDNKNDNIEERDGNDVDKNIEFDDDDDDDKDEGEDEDEEKHPNKKLKQRVTKSFTRTNYYQKLSDLYDQAMKFKDNGSKYMFENWLKTSNINELKTSITGDSSIKIQWIPNGKTLPPWVSLIKSARNHFPLATPEGLQRLIKLRDLPDLEDFAFLGHISPMTKNIVPILEQPGYQSLLSQNLIIDTKHASMLMHPIFDKQLSEFQRRIFQISRNVKSAKFSVFQDSQFASYRSLFDKATMDSLTVVMKNGVSCITMPGGELPFAGLGLVSLLSRFCDSVVVTCPSFTSCRLAKVYQSIQKDTSTLKLIVLPRAIQSIHHSLLHPDVDIKDLDMGKVAKEELQYLNPFICRPADGIKKKTTPKSINLFVIYQSHLTDWTQVLRTLRWFKINHILFIGEHGVTTTSNINSLDMISSICSVFPFSLYQKPINKTNSASVTTEEINKKDGKEKENESTDINDGLTYIKKTLSRKVDITNLLIKIDQSFQLLPDDPKLISSMVLSTKMANFYDNILFVSTSEEDNIFVNNILSSLLRPEYQNIYIGEKDITTFFVGDRILFTQDILRQTAKGLELIACQGELDYIKEIILCDSQFTRVNHIQKSACNFKSKFSGASIRTLSNRTILLEDSFVQGFSVLLNSCNIPTTETVVLWMGQHCNDKLIDRTAIRYICSAASDNFIFIHGQGNDHKKKFCELVNKADRLETSVTAICKSKFKHAFAITQS